MGGKLFRRHGGQPFGPLGGIFLLLAQFPIQFGLAGGRRAVWKLDDVPLPAAWRLPAMYAASPVPHGWIDAR
jgi:hypothetical protein